MNQISNIFAALAIFSLTACDGVESLYERSQKSEHLVEEFANNYPALSISIYRDDDIVWTYNHGFEDVENKRPISENTRFNIYSTSKALTGLAFARLIDSGIVSLSGKVGEITPDVPIIFHEIRLKDILSHRSGIRHYASPMDWLGFTSQTCENPSAAVAYFADDPLIVQPGTKESYSSFAFVLASEVLLRITGADNFKAALNETLGPWAHYELDSKAAAKAQPLIRAAILPQMPEGLKPEDIIPMPPLSSECKFGAGGLIVSSKELARAGAALYQGNIIAKDKMKDAFRPWFSASQVVYGAALNEEQGTWELSGGAPGGRSYLLVSINDQVSIAIAGNIDGPNMRDIAHALLDLWRP
ncbi:MAG: serine hydrolase domain-containing protein [Sphingomonadales bacterium]